MTLSRDRYVRAQAEVPDVITKWQGERVVACRAFKADVEAKRI